MQRIAEPQSAAVAQVLQPVDPLPALAVAPALAPAPPAEVGVVQSLEPLQPRTSRVPIEATVSKRRPNRKAIHTAVQFPLELNVTEAVRCPTCSFAPDPKTRAAIQCLWH